MSRAEETAVGAAPNVDLRGPTDPTPFDRDTDARRIIDCECLTCDAAETIYAEAGRTRRWEHDIGNPSHVVEYRRETDATATQEG
ncbi:hypothetical protein [Halobellus ordinarius]|uniref:hypothetical protein n=1 Tax=Halobellus ordinarius TaxID=3075120 RepID=UPI002880816A|nr:hypothetical protein [Halobellus sp. ZY16]